MKSFKSYITESTEGKPLKTDFFIHTDGKLIEPRKMPLKSLFIDHVYIPLTQPEDFGMKEHEMDDLLGFSDLEKLELYTTGRGPLETRIFHELSNRGFLKGVNRKHTDEPKHTIRLEAAKSSILGRHNIKDMIEPIRTLRSRITPEHDLNLHISGLKFHEPDDLHELQDSLSPEHIKELTDEARVHFKNIQEVDRFLGTSTKRSRNPGMGLEPTPSPEEMRAKAGKTDEPESIQRGRFFQSDSYNPVLGLRAFINEFTEHEDYLGNTLFAIGHDGKLRLKDSPPGQVREHPDSFPDLNFGGPTSWENDMGMTDEHKNRPKPIAHGRIDHKKRLIQIITRHGGPMPYGDPAIRPLTGIKKLKEDIEEDGFNRLAVMKYLKPYKHFKIYVSKTEYNHVLHSFKEHEKYITDLMKD